MENKIVMGAITATIVIILVASALIPVINDASASSDTFSNEGYYYMDHITAGQHEDIIIEYTKSPQSFTYNGVEMDVSQVTAPRLYTLMGSSDWVVRFAYNYGIQAIGVDFNFGGSSAIAVNITVSSGIVTATIETAEGTTTYTKAYDDLWIYSPVRTDWVMKKMDESAYMGSDSEFYAIGVTEISTWNNVLYITGTVDSWNVNIVYPPNQTTTTSDKVTVTSINDTHDDLYLLDQLQFTVSDGTNSVNATYSYFIVPAEVTAERSIHATPGQAALYKVIPVLIFVALLVGVIGYGIYRYRD